MLHALVLTETASHSSGPSSFHELIVEAEQYYIFEVKEQSCFDLSRLVRWHSSFLGFRRKILSLKDLCLSGTRVTPAKTKVTRLNVHADDHE
jgi:hypothetical protein